MEENRHRREGDNQSRKSSRPRIKRGPATPVSYDDEKNVRRAGGRPEKNNHQDKPFEKKNNSKGGKFAKNAKGSRPTNGPKNGQHKNFKGKKKQESFFKGSLAPLDQVTPEPKKTHASEGLVRLNKYISNAGVCSRRDADKLIESGAVTVNGEIITQMGYLVKEGDIVNYGGATLKSEAKRYFLLNKPKGYITTLDDPQERQTVMDLIGNACKERIYPVGRLDRNTTGLLLFTNDGELSKKLTHPSSGVYKVYQVELDRPVTREDMQQMLEGIELEDGVIKVDDVQYAMNVGGQPGIDRRIVGVQLHSGKNRIVRRIFESMGYKVHKLDRTVFAGLTKKDLPRGRYRELTDHEMNFLKMI